MWQAQAGNSVLLIAMYIHRLPERPVPTHLGDGREVALQHVQPPPRLLPQLVHDPLHRLKPFGRVPAVQGMGQGRRCGGMGASHTPLWATAACALLSD